MGTIGTGVREESVGEQREKEWNLGSVQEEGSGRQKSDDEHQEDHHVGQRGQGKDLATGIEGEVGGKVDAAEHGEDRDGQHVALVRSLPCSSV